MPDPDGGWRAECETQITTLKQTLKKERVENRVYRTILEEVKVRAVSYSCAKNRKCGFIVPEACTCTMRKG